MSARRQYLPGGTAADATASYLLHWVARRRSRSCALTKSQLWPPLSFVAWKRRATTAPASGNLSSTWLRPPRARSDLNLRYATLSAGSSARSWNRCTETTHLSSSIAHRTRCFSSLKSARAPTASASRPRICRSGSHAKFRAAWLSLKTTAVTVWACQPHFNVSCSLLLQNVANRSLKGHP